MAVSRQEQRAEETRRAILAAASELFSERGFQAVTMREIAKAAGCSHTTIYLYFQDKETLLHKLSMAPLQALYEQMQGILADEALVPEHKLKSLSSIFLRFCLAQKNMVTIFFMAKGSRVDEVEPELAVQKLRNQLFGCLRQALQLSLQLPPDDEDVWACARIYFFTLQGIVGTYTGSEEPFDVLMERLEPTFDLAMEVLLRGFQETLRARGANS